VSDKLSYDKIAALVAECYTHADAANDGKPGALGKLQDFLSRNPAFAPLIDMNAEALEGIIKAWQHGAGNQELTKASAKKTRGDMGYKEAGPVERLLIDRVVLCWLRLLYAESYCTATSKPGTTFKEADLGERSLSRAHNRFLRAVEALERYRVLIQAERMAKAKADLLEAKAGEVRLNKANGALRLLKQATG
jgi:hypothetical protein